ncbi:MAG: sulfatase [Planctomycetaceae bacterium]|nr:sulfatase [Planctomycetaceae bacterium]
MPPRLKPLVICLLLLSCPIVAAEDRLNVLLITVDDMNCDSVGIFGCDVDDITPNIDRLASEGMRFEHAHVTIAICQPTRAVWMTGRYPHRNGALGFDPIRADVPTMLERLHSAGYQTGILAKVKHVVPTRKAAWDVIIPATELQVGRSPQRYYESSLAFFRQAKQSDKPFFLMANSQDPHRPFAGSQQENNRLNGKRPGTDFPPTSRQYGEQEVTTPGFLPDLPKVRREIAEYYSSVHRADEIVGSVLRALAESGLENQTLVIFLSDHGMPLPFAKTNCWYHSTRTPLIVRWPGVILANRHDQQHVISGIDLAPTILSAVHLPPIKGADGRSFESVLKGSKQPNRKFAFTHINRTAGKNNYPMRSIVDSRFGYIYNGWADGKTRFKNESQSGLTMKAMQLAAKSDPNINKRVQHFLYRTPEEFYDYQQDPDARLNLINNPRYRQQIQQRRLLLQQHMKETSDPQLEAFQQLIQPSLKTTG